jgi:crotonobetainyl-CoA:carnitine CoA-transferase CaiB-like acyl-CoA transferase
MLDPYRVIDLTDEHGLLCGQILADLGADVVHVEPPGGSPARRVGPFAGDVADPERSLFWWAHTRGQRSVTLDLDAAEGRDALRRLVRGADFLIESEKPGRLDALGLGHDALLALNPSLVHVSVTPFGQTGPKAHYEATDLTQMAAGGPAYLTGDADRPPLRVSVPQAHAHAGADAAVGALLAHFERRRTGRGQHVDVSQQQSVTLATQFRSLDVLLDELPAKRLAGGVLVAGVWIPLRYALRDGWVVLGPAMLPSTGHFMTRLVEWMHEEGACPATWLDEAWGSYALRLIQGEVSADDFAKIDSVLASFFAARSKQEIMEQAVERRLLIAPVLELGEIVDGEHLRARGFAVELAPPELGRRVRFPGPFARFGRTPIRVTEPPPALDAHGAEIRAEAPRRPVFDPDANAARRADDASEAGAGEGPLAGVRVLDLFWVLAGPGATRMLADYGATVVHVESTRHVDTLRVIPPYRFANPHPEGAGAYQCANANKLGLTLDVRRPESREILLDLVRWADVVTESFTPGVLEGLGLGYEALRAVRPDLVMISSCLMGQSGPWRDFTGFGNLAASVTGYQTLASWPDRPPAGPYGAYTDFVALRYNAVAILAALEHRARTGEGQYIDQSQAEAALHFLGPAFLDHTVNGRRRDGRGNDDDGLCPHGVYPCAGEDRWVAIAVRSDAEWRALCRILRCEDLAAARDAGAVVDEAIAAWTSARSPDAVERALQAAGIPAHAVLDTTGLAACPQLAHREHFLEIGCEIYQSTAIESSRLRLSRSVPRRPERALSFGRDNRYVLETILGRSPEQIAALAEAGVLL